MKRDNLSAAATCEVELAGYGDTSLYRPEESIGSKAPANCKPSNLVGDVNQSVDNFDIWRLLKQNRAVEIPHAVGPSRSNATELGDIGTNPENKCKSLTGLNVPFLSTALFFGRTAEPLRGVVSVTSTPTPANDNHLPSEAA